MNTVSDLDLLDVRVWQAKLDLEFVSDQDGRTILAKKLHSGPLMVQKALYPEGDDICHAVILHPPAGIAGGDHLEINLSLGKKAKAVVCTPGATKWYKSNGRDASQSIDIVVESDAHLDFLPQENIFFNEVSASSTTKIEQLIGSSFIGWEINQLGRVAAGETWSDAIFHSSVDLRFNGKTVWTELGSIDSESTRRFQSFGLHGLNVFSTMWMCSPFASREIAEELASNLPWGIGIRMGVTHFELTDGQGLIVVRGLSAEVEDLKNILISIWLNVRERISGVVGKSLRLWLSLIHI